MIKSIQTKDYYVNLPQMFLEFSQIMEYRSLSKLASMSVVYVIGTFQILEHTGKSSHQKHVQLDVIVVATILNSKRNFTLLFFYFPC